MYVPKLCMYVLTLFMYVCMYRDRWDTCSDGLSGERLASAWLAVEQHPERTGCRPSIHIAVFKELPQPHRQHHIVLVEKGVSVKVAFVSYSRILFHSSSS